MLKVELIKGDITNVEAEALVNAANNQLWMGAGVAGALKRVGGFQIETNAMKSGPIKVGEVAVTRAGRLKAKYVIHAAVMGQDLTPSETSIKNATINSLKKAEELGIKTIAFPALGTGVGRMPVEVCAQIMLMEVKTFSDRAKRLEKVIFVLFRDSDYRIFSEEAQRQGM
jgi:O-acetyl-ADP-ribose deacetylase